MLREVTIIKTLIYNHCWLFYFPTAGLKRRQHSSPTHCSALSLQSTGIMACICPLERMWLKINFSLE